MVCAMRTPPPRPRWSWLTLATGTLRVAIGYLRWAAAAFVAVFVERADVSLTQGAKPGEECMIIIRNWIVLLNSEWMNNNNRDWTASCDFTPVLNHPRVLVPVTFLFGQDDVPRGDVGEQADRGLFPASFPLFVQGMVVVVHLLGQRESR